MADNLLPQDALEEMDRVITVSRAYQQAGESCAEIDPNMIRRWRMALTPPVLREIYASVAISQPHPSAVPEGWKLVPVEPTAAMVTAGCRAPTVQTEDSYLRSMVTCAYRAMVSAAPPAPLAWRPMETQSTIADWADGVFGPHQGPVPPLLRSINELVEACIAAGISQQEFRARVDAEFVRQVKKGAAADLTNLPAEVAGTVIVLYRVAQAAGFDLHAAVDAEMRKNRGRQWFAKGDGTGHHLPAPPAPAEREG